MRKSYHVRIRSGDLQGNSGSGRFVFLPGSAERATQIAGHFIRRTTRSSERGFDLHLGQLQGDNGLIDVAAISSGMGSSSLEIILNELLQFGAKRVLRIGTAGSLQPSVVKVPSVVIVTGAVRNEDVSKHYCPIEVPAMASIELVNSLCLAARKLRVAERVYLGVVHTKSALYAMEFRKGPLAAVNAEYMAILARNGVLASEMECSSLFTICRSLSPSVASLAKLGKDPKSILAGGILAIVGDRTPFSNSSKVRTSIALSIEIGLECARNFSFTQQFSEYPGVT